MRLQLRGDVHGLRARTAICIVIAWRLFGARVAALGPPRGPTVDAGGG